MIADRIRVDFNNVLRSGRIRASARRAAVELHPGDTIVVYQPGEDMEHLATVKEVDPVTQKMELEVDWTSRPGGAEARVQGSSVSTSRRIHFVVPVKPSWFRQGATHSGAALATMPRSNRVPTGTGVDV